MIVPFFGDQPFWGAMVAKAKAGAHECIPYKKLTAERLAEGIKQCLTEEARKNVQKLAENIIREGDGALNAVRSFHRSLPLKGDNDMRCHLIENRCAAWRLNNTSIQLSPLAAELLVEWKKVKWNELRLLRNFEWNDFGGPGEPVTAMWGAIIGTADDVVKGVGLAPLKMAKSVKKREKYYQKRLKAKRKQKNNGNVISKTDQAAKDGKQGMDGSTERTSNGMATKNARPAAPERHESVLSVIIRPEDWLAEELAQEAAHGLKKAGAAILKSPMTFTLALAQGFHNAPRLYGDDTVRRPHRITGFHSGVRAGRDEFVYGIHDGVTGIWRQPVRGAKEGGALGFLRGFGMGVGGLLLKSIAAGIGPPAYLMKGCDEERRKKYQPTAYLRRARIVQGRVELAALGPRTRRGGYRDVDADSVRKRREIETEVSRKWDALQPRIAEEKKLHQSGLRAALLGRSPGKEGKHVPFKDRRAGLPDSEAAGDDFKHPRKAQSVPMTNGRVSENGAVKKTGTGGARRGSAPGFSLGWKDRRERGRARTLGTTVDA
jgi:hypothetical protein